MRATFGLLTLIGITYGLYLPLCWLNAKLEQRRKHWEYIAAEGKRLDEEHALLKQESAALNGLPADQYTMIAAAGFNEDIDHYIARSMAWRAKMDQPWWRTTDSHPLADSEDHPKCAPPTMDRRQTP